MNRPVPPPAEEVGWQKELDELAERKRIAQQMGGKERVDRQHAGGRLTVRERIDKTLDPGSFHELGAVAGKAKYDQDGKMIDFVPGNGVFGRGRVDGRPVIIFGDDFTVRGGSADASIREKYQMPERMAAEFRMPIIRIIEGSGGGGSVKTIETKGYANLPGGISASSGLHLCAINMGLVPVVALGLGSVAGLGAARLSASHFSLMVKDSSAVFVAGPPVVDRLGEKRTKQELGGHKVQIAAGTVDDAVDSEEEAFARARKFLSYLPSSIWELPPRAETWDDPNRRDESLLNAVPRNRKKAYQMRRIIELGGRSGLVLRDCPRVWPRHHHRLRAARRLAGRHPGRRPACMKAARGMPLPRARSRSSSTPARPSIFRSSISSTVLASRSACRRSPPARCALRCRR